MIFRNWIMQNFPFLEDDFDALTDYELFCKMVEYMKKALEKIDNYDSTITELTNKVNELENYFNNLDVQEEVNNKLDEMASDGTLDEIINQEIFGNLNTEIETVDGRVTTLSNTTEASLNALVKFNNFTSKPLQYGKLNLPSQFSNIGFNLYRNINNTITDDLNLSIYNTVNTVYVDYDNGDDSSHPNSTFKTIKGALTYINSLSGNNYKIICKTYRFGRNEFGDQTENAIYTMNKSVIIEPEDSTKDIIVGNDDRNLSWSNQGNGVWLTTRSNVRHIWNMQKKDVYGMFFMLTKVTTLTECQNTPNTWYQSGSNLYVHSNEEPTFDKYIITLSSNIAGFSISNNRFLRLKNIKFYIAYGMQFINNDTTNYENALICENIEIYGQDAETSNGFTVNNIKTVYMKNCKTGYNKRDGFNYHYTHMPTSIIENAIVYENNCSAFNNGLEHETDINNCSTIHEGGRIIRANCLYQNSKRIIIADVGSPRVLMINCGINQNINNTNYRCFNFQNNEGDNSGIAYLIDCKALQKQGTTLTGTSNFKIRIKNFLGDYINEDLDIQLYNE